MTDATNLTYAEVADTTEAAQRKGAAAAERVADDLSGIALLMWHVLDLGPADWFEALHPSDEAVLDANDSPYTDAPHADAWATTFWDVLTERASAQWDAETRVERGAALLDDRHPGWWDRIDLDHLTMSSPCMCIIGQVLGDYFRVDMLGLGTEAEAEDHGFNTASVPFSPPHGPAASDRDYELLAEEWRSSILSRRRIPPR